MSKGKRYSSELRERAVRVVFEHAKVHESQWGSDLFDLGQGGLHVRDASTLGSLVAG